MARKNLLQVEQNHGENIVIKPKPRILASISQGLLNILTNAQAPKEVYALLSNLTGTCMKEFSNHMEHNSNSMRVDEYEHDIQDIVQKKVKKNGLVRNCTYMPTYLRIRNIPKDNLKGDHVELLDDVRNEIMYNDPGLDTDMHYSLEYVTIRFSLSDAHTSSLLNALIPMGEKYTANMSDIHEAANYMQLGKNIFLQYSESKNEFYYNIITLVKATRAQDKGINEDPQQARHLVGVCKPFVESEEVGIGKTTAVKNKELGKIIPFKSA